MLRSLEFAAIGLAVLNVLFICILVARRVWLTRRARNEAALEESVGALALDLVHGEPVDRALGRREQLALAQVLTRYSRLVRGDARRNIAAYFGTSEAYWSEYSDLKSRKPWRRASAAFVLGDMAVEGAASALIGALHDRDRDVRAAAARSLGRLQAPAAVQPLVRSLADGSLPFVVAGTALLAIGEQALPQLQGLLRASEPGVRAVAVELTGLLGGARETPALAAALTDTSAEVREQAAVALWRLGARDAAEALRRALADRVPSVRAAAAAALGTIRDPAALWDLIDVARADAFAPAQAAAHAAAAIDRETVAAAAAAVDAGPHLREVADLVAL